MEETYIRWDKDDVEKIKKRNCRKDDVEETWRGQRTVRLNRSKTFIEMTVIDILAFMINNTKMNYILYV